MEELVNMNILWDFEIEANHPVTNRKQDLVLVDKKRSCHRVDFAVLKDPTVRLKYSEKTNKSIDLEGDKYEVDSVTNSNWCTWNVPERTEKETKVTED